MTREEAIEIVRLTCPRIEDSVCDFETAMRTLVPELEQTSDSDEQIKSEIKEVLQAACVSDGKMTYGRYIQYSAWLDKQGKQENYEWNGKITRRKAKGTLKDMIDSIYSAHFRPGDWVVHNQNSNIPPIKIIKIEGNNYIFDSDTAEYDKCEIKTLEEYWHLWSIRDAQEGDILATEYGRPFIFKGLLDPDHPDSPTAYCGIDCMDQFITSTGTRWWTDSKVEPATNKQKEYLFKEMSEYGYTWDFEKKLIEPKTE